MASRRRFQPQAQRRSSKWAFGPDSLDQSISADGLVVWSNGSSIVNEPQATLVRTRGYVNIVLKTSGGVSNGFAGALGIALFTTEAFAAGAASMFDPQIEADWDGWLWHQFFDVRTATATIADGANANTISQRIEIDSKAMRKQTVDQVLVGLVGVVESGVATMSLNADTRCLYKLT